MPSLNKVFLLGNLTRDPDLRGLPSGQSVCELRLAVSRRYLSNGQECEDTCFVDVVVWGKSANNCKQFLAKGSQVMVEGRLQLDQWEDRNGGGQRSKLRVVAEQIQFMTRRPQEGGYPPRDNAYPPREGNYPPRDNAYSPREGNYPPREGNYPPRDNVYPPREGNYGAQGGEERSFGSYNRSVNPAAAPVQRQDPSDLPPMPEQPESGDSTAMVDDIPF